MRKFLILFSVLLLAFPVIGQERSGNIYGKVVDENGEPLPGVTVTLTGSVTAPVSTTSGINGDFRFISLPPAKDYALTAKLQGFKTKREESIIVTVGTNITLTIVMEMGTLEEVITVTAEVPVIDMKATARTFNADREIMQSIPSARDTLSVFEWVPGVAPDKAWVGTSNMGYMNNATARAGRGSYWGQYSVDGVRLEWSYGDHDMWEEVQVSIGGVNIKSRSGDLVTNLVTKRGGDNFGFQGRFFATDEKFQADHKDAIEEHGILGIDKIILNKEYGFNIGGPLIKDKAWFWLGYAVQDSKIRLSNLDPVNHVLTSYNAKINLQLLPQNRIEIWGFANDKLGLGRSASTEFPEGYKQFSPFHFGSPKGRIGIEHTLGDNLFVSLVGGYSDSGFRMQPTRNLGGELIGLTNITTSVNERQADFDGDHRPRYDVYFFGNYFNDTLFGASHEIKFGVEYETIKSAGSWSRQNVVKNYNYNYGLVDFTGDGIPDINKDICRFELRRWAEQDLGRDIISGYISDTITAGQFNVVLGLRYDTTSLFVNDVQVKNSVLKDTPAWQDNFTSQTADVINNLIPEFVIPGKDPGYGWGYLSPRIGIIWDVGGRGTTLAKLSWGRYPAKSDLISYTKGAQYLPSGAEARLYFWWLDNNSDGIADFTELYWHDSASYAPYRVFDDAGNFTGNWTDARQATPSMWSDFDPFNPTQLTNPTRVIPDEAQKAETAMEVSASVEHELMPDFMVGVNFTYKLYDNYIWAVDYWPDTGAIGSNNDYVAAGTVPNTVAGESTYDGDGQSYYLKKAGVTSTDWRIEQARPDYNHKYYGVDLVFNKRLSNKWMLGGSFTLQSDKRDYGDNGYIDPSEVWGRDGGPESYRFPRWIGKLHGLYRLPYGINIGFMLYAREGWGTSQTLQIRDYNAPGTDRDSTVYLSQYGSNREPTFVSLAIKLEKMLIIGDTGRFYFSADLFNVPNLSTVVRRYDDRIGRWFPHNDSLSPYAQRNMARQITNPRAVRLGIRFQF